MRRAASLLALVLAAAACDPEALPPASPPAPAETAATTTPTTTIPRLDAIPRLDFNRLAAELYLPLFWIDDADHSGAIEPNELAVLWGVAPVAPSSPRYVEEGRFTPAFLAAYAAMVKVKSEGHPTAGLSEPEKKRRAAVLTELAQGRPALVRSDFRGASAEDRALIGHVLAAARIIEQLYLKQAGTAGLDAEIQADDPASRMLFYRNHGPLCQSAKMEKDPECNAVPRRPARLSGMYPASVQKDPKFCEKLEARKDQKALLGPFNVVVEKGGELAPEPYNVAYKAEMEAVSRELAAAAAAITSPGEAPLKAYLEADARAFLDNDWGPSDEAWAKMSVNNSRWYLRVGPDETYADPCSRKAGFHVSFARINQDSLAWQRKLDPLKLEMEGALAKLAGAPYQARKVSFHLPDFIDIVLNAGDSRSATGATIGQSLPNWGPVANEGRGRTVAMTNLYTDADSRTGQRDKAESLLCKASFDPGALDPALSTMGTVLHEAAHNLGPAHEYRVKGKTDAEVFGGPLAATFEELKAQTSSLYLADWLTGRGVVEKKQATLAHQADILWAFGHIAEGMYAADGTPKPYSQLAAIQVGSFLAAGAVAFHADEMAANGRDKGCVAFTLDKLPAAIAALEKTVLGVKGRGDKAGALELRAELVDKDGEWKKLRELIAERWQRQPRASFVYAVEL